MLVEEKESVIPQESDQQAPETAKPVSNEAQEVIDSWEKDPRTDKVWKKDPNNLYKSYRNLEKSYTPTQQVLKEFGFNTPDELKAALGEYKGYKDPNNELNQFLTYIAPILENEKYQGQFKSTLEKLRAELDKEQFGPHLNEQEILALKEAKEAKAEMQKFREEREVEQIKTEINTQLSEIEKYAESMNLQFDKNEFLKYCRDKNVPTNLMRDIFEAKARPFAEKAAAEKREQAVLKNIKNNQAGNISSGNKVSAPKGQPLSYLEQIDRVLDRA